MKNITQLFRKAILKGTTYKEVKPNSKEISASELTNDYMQILNKQKYGVIERDLIGHNTIGSILHLGMEQVIRNTCDNIPDFIGARLEYTLKPYKYKGWKLTGTADCISVIDGKGHIIDYKTMAEYKEKKLKEAIVKGKIYDENYIVQLNVYRFLYFLETGIDADIYILSFSRGKGINRKMGIFQEPIELIEIPKIENDFIENKFKSFVDMLIMNIMPEECNQMQYGKFNNKPAKCELYCNYKNVCKLYKEQQNEYADKFNF